MGQKSSKGTVAISNFQGRIRLRWSYQGKRYSINLDAYSGLNLLKARKVALQIEQDILLGRFDTKLDPYIGKVKGPDGPDLSFTERFEFWVKNYKQMDCEVHTNYNSTRNMIRKWGKVDESNVVQYLNQETFCNNTYNRRLTLLKDFANWLVSQKFWQANPLNSVCRKRPQKTKQEKRTPFTDDEISRILAAFRTDQFCSLYSVHKHSHYYPFVYFMFKTGVRNAEAVGLRVKHLDLKKKQIEVKEALARTLQGSSANKRIRKATKNEKERKLPLTDDLLAVLTPLLKNRKPDDLVFLSHTGKALNDENFRKRVFYKVLDGLGIPPRVLYATRHTFNSRCIDQGISPVMTAFLMGNNPETALKRYTHQMTLPKDLPTIE